MTLHFLPTEWPAALLFWTATAVFVVAHVGILRSVLRAKERRAVEIVWALLPPFALAGVLLMTWRSMHPGM